jgi:hypothetical protein
VDEIEWSKSKTRPVKGFEEARRRPALLLIGLTIGIACAWLAGLISPIFAPILPLLVGGVAVLFKRTQAPALGVLAAACGVLVFLLTMAVLFMVF